jgi:tRNA threonylcarbamoyladenosine biosynthesis protein TsaE
MQPKPPRLEPSTTPAAGRGSHAATARSVFALSEQETFDFGRNFAAELRGGELLVLEGDLGLGKTVFARGVAAGLGVDPDDVRSPSYTLVHEYLGGRVPVFHIDLYRIQDGDDLGTLGIDEILAAGGLVLVEWGERLPPFYRREALTVRLHDIGEGSRRIELVPAPRPTDRPRGDA